MFNPVRLTLARQRRRLTKVALGELVGLTARRLAAFENEGEIPPEGTVELLAEALKFPPDFFRHPAPVRLEPGSASFRSFSRLAASDRAAALAGAALAIELSAWLENRFRLPARDLPDLRDVGPVEAAAAVRSAWGLGHGPAPNMVHLLEAHGVRIFSLVDDCSALDAISLWADGMPFVFLTSHKSPERARWDAAHELGHLLLHLDTPPHGKEQEVEADEFARELLLPEPGVRASAARFPSFTDILRDKIVWQVSALAYTRRLHQLGYLSDWAYRSLVVEASQAGYRRQEGDIERETSQLIPKVLGLLREDGVGLRDVADALAIDVAELRGLLFFPLNVLEGGGQVPSGRDGARHLRAVKS